MKQNSFIVAYKQGTIQSLRGYSANSQSDFKQSHQKGNSTTATTFIKQSNLNLRMKTLINKSKKS